ncbi:hypothetical protein E4U41_001751 [Claviceps citrina]|nr:hypothetical protein E4U41_001751 [Claviceps citrina]
MTLCKFYQQGACKYGNSCRFEHPGAGNNRNQSQNRFGALAAGGRDGDLEDALSKYSITIETIEKDLTTEAPQWILSAYAPGRNAPEQLFGGFPREQSFEEMRLHYLTAKASGNEQQALNQAQELYQNARQQMQTAVGNIQDAARFIVEAENRHPNRHDICREGTQGAPFGEFSVSRRSASVAQAPGQAANPFGSAASGSTASPSPSAFGQPSALGKRPHPFAARALSQAAQAAQPQASPFGQAPQPSASSAFGQTAQTGSAFGQPSTLGAKPNPFAAPAFGQTAQPAASTGGSVFGQASQLGGAKPNPFSNAAAAPAPAANPFANAGSAPPAATANPFAQQQQQQQQAQNTSPFGQAGSQLAKPNPFAVGNNPEPQPTSNPFAQTTQNTQNTQNGTNGAFGSNNASVPFGQPQQNPFAQTQQPPAPAPPAAAVAPAASRTATGKGATSPYPPGSSKAHAALESYVTHNADGTLASFKGKPVTYKGEVPGIRAFNGTWTRIWFPAGAPAYYKDTELSSDEYDRDSLRRWADFARTGRFADGVMPELPPPRECTLWDF